MIDHEVKYTVVGFAPEEIHQQFQNIRKQYQLPFIETPTPQGNIILGSKAHITLKRSAFLKAGATEEELLKALEQCNFEPIPIKVCKQVSWQTNNNGIVIATEVNDHPLLTKTHQDLVTLTSGILITKDPQFEGQGFKAHFSAAYHVPENTAEEIIKKVSTILPFNFLLQDLSLLRSINQKTDERKIIHSYQSTN